MKKFIQLFGMLLLGTLIVACGDSDQHNTSMHDDHGDVNEAEVIKGPHGGRLLESDNFTLELSIFETGLPPEFHIYPYFKNQPVSPDEVSLNIELKRLGGKNDHIRFTPVNDYLRGDSVVTEPHSFEVNVTASYQGREYSWHYDNFEGRTQIVSQMADEMQIRTEEVSPVVLTESIALTGRIQTNPNKISRVTPRFPGVIKTIRKELGDFVKAGEELTTIQSNESLQNYTLTAPIDGVVVKRDLQIGEAADTAPLFVIADHSELWVELDVFSHDLMRVKSGQSVLIETLDGTYQQLAEIDWVSPLAAHASQSVRARVIISNEEGSFRPGQFVRGHVTISKREVPLAVKRSAIQGFRDFQVVFARFEDVYEVRMLELGKSNKEWVEVIGGIESGTEYVTENSYLIKADIEKSGASHDH